MILILAFKRLMYRNTNDFSNKTIKIQKNKKQSNFFVEIIGTLLFQLHYVKDYTGLIDYITAELNLL